MTLVKDSNFYWPFPVFGIPVNEQWYRIRTDTELLKPIVESTYYENTDGIRGHASLAGFEFGEQEFINKYRVVYIDSSDELHFQCNEGTADIPIWHDLFHLDCDGSPSQIFFSSSTTFDDLVVLGDFYGDSGGLNSITVKDGIHTFQSSTGIISLNHNDFYLTQDSLGNPTINFKGTSSGSSGITSVTFSDGTHSFSDDTLKFNSDQFYLTQDSAGNPQANVVFPPASILVPTLVTFDDGVHTYTDDTLKFNHNQFYLTQDSSGNPKVNSVFPVDTGISFITINDGVHTYTDDTLKLNPDQFYLTQDSAGNPEINSIFPVFNSSITFSDGTHSFSDDTLVLNHEQFYLTQDSAGNPKVNVINQGITFRDGIHTVSDDTLNFNPTHFYLSQDSNGNPLVNSTYIPATDVSLLERQTTTSGTSKDFTGIPVGVNRIQVIMDRISLTGSVNDVITIQIGTSSGVEVTGYVNTGSFIPNGSAPVGQASTDGFSTYIATDSEQITGIITLARIVNNFWAASGVYSHSTTTSGMLSGVKNLSGTLDQVRLTITGGVATFDGGNVAVNYDSIV